MVWLTLLNHVPGGAKLPNLIRFETNKAIGDNAPYYRTADLWFDDMASMQACLGSPIGQGAVADLDNFAKGRHKVLITEVHNVKLPTTARA